MLIITSSFSFPHTHTITLLLTIKAHKKLSVPASGFSKEFQSVRETSKGRENKEDMNKWLELKGKNKLVVEIHR